MRNTHKIFGFFIFLGPLYISILIHSVLAQIPVCDGRPYMLVKIAAFLPTLVYLELCKWRTNVKHQTGSFWPLIVPLARSLLSRALFGHRTHPRMHSHAFTSPKMLAFGRWSSEGTTFSMFYAAFVFPLTSRRRWLITAAAVNPRESNVSEAPCPASGNRVIGAAPVPAAN